MKSFLHLFLLTLFASAALAQITVPLTIDGSFVISSWTQFGPNGDISGLNNPDFPSPLSCSFSLTLDVPLSGDFSVPDVKADRLTISPSPFGHTIFSPENTGLEIFFTDGKIDSLLLGGVEGGINSWSGTSNPAPNTPSDIFLLLELKPDFRSKIFFYQIDGFVNTYFSQDIAFTLTETAATGTPVPESASYGYVAGLICLGLVFVRHKYSRTGC